MITYSVSPFLFYKYGNNRHSYPYYYRCGSCYRIYERFPETVGIHSRVDCRTAGCEDVIFVFGGKALSYGHGFYDCCTDYSFCYDMDCCSACIYVGGGYFYQSNGGSFFGLYQSLARGCIGSIEVFHFSQFNYQCNRVYRH